MIQMFHSRATGVQQGCGDGVGRRYQWQEGIGHQNKPWPQIEWASSLIEGITPDDAYPGVLVR
jgi:hypothetical protein